MRPFRTALLVPTAALALSACGDGDGDGDGDAAGRPAPDSCTTLPGSPDGSYQVADAGTVAFTREGDTLVLGEVTAADGWTAEEIDREDDEIEVEFRGDGVELDFEAEIDDGALRIEVCDDDD